MKCKMSEPLVPHWAAPPSEPMDLSCAVVSRNVAATSRSDDNLGFTEFKDRPLDLSMTSSRSHLDYLRGYSCARSHGNELTELDYRYRANDLDHGTSGYNSQSSWNRRSPYNVCGTGYDAAPCTSSRDTYYYDGYHASSSTGYENCNGSWHEPQTSTPNSNMAHYKYPSRQRSPSHAHSYRPYRYPDQGRYGQNKSASPDYYRQQYGEYERYARDYYTRQPEHDLGYENNANNGEPVNRNNVYSSGGDFTYSSSKLTTSNTKRKNVGAKAHGLKYGEPLGHVVGDVRHGADYQANQRAGSHIYGDEMLKAEGAHVISSNTHCAGCVVTSSKSPPKGDPDFNLPDEIRPINIPLHLLSNVSLAELNKPEGVTESKEISMARVKENDNSDSKESQNESPGQSSGLDGTSIRIKQEIP